MSVEALSHVLHEVAISGNAKVILLGMANHAHPDGTNSYPSMTTLAKYASVDRRTAQRNVRQLEQGGWIEREGVGPVGQTRWRVLMNRPAAGGAADCRPGAASDTPGGRHERSGGAAPMPPEPPRTNKETESATHSHVDLDPNIQDLERVGIFDAWIEATRRDPSRTKLSTARRATITAALAEYGYDDCLAAVTNIGRDEWAGGLNDRGRPFNDLAHALGSSAGNRAERIEKWRDWQPPGANGNGAGRRPARGSMEEAQARQDRDRAQYERMVVLDAQEGNT